LKTDPIELAIFKSTVHSVAEEMGATLRRTSFSPNIKERRDYSCAVFDANGEAIAMGDHMPVHLGSMPMSVRNAIEQVELEPGDMAILNDPYGGGTHLPDITMVLPVFQEADATKPIFYVANRAHHADVGGQYPGSMGLCREIYQEGIRIPPVKILRRGEIVRDVLNLVLSNVRTPWEREGDLTAQIGSCRVGERRLRDIIAKYGLEKIARLSEALLQYSEELVRSELARAPQGFFEAEDFLDDDGIGGGPVRLAVKLTFDPAQRKATVNFEGSSRQVASSINAVYAITYSAVYYVFRCLLPADAPATAGVMNPIQVIAPAESIVNAAPPAPVAGGNVETSQRIVDVLMRALAQAFPERVPAASSGTMNNLTIGGIDQRSGKPFAYYETVAGGMGGRPTADGISGVHTHMTNSLNTPAEALEYAYPLRVLRYAYRERSGGAGKFRGGDGLIREVELLSDAQLTLLADRRRFAPYGLRGGADGARGVTTLIQGTKETQLPGKCSIAGKEGDRIRLETPGGGGWGTVADSDSSA
jgi:N-methylhydantoinase B